MTDIHIRRAEKARKAEKEFSQSRLVRFMATVVSVMTWPLAWLPIGAGLALGAWGGRLAFALLAERRKIAVSNIEKVQAAGFLDPGLKAAATARESFANMGRSGWEALRLYHRGLKPFEGLATVESGGEYLRAALGKTCEKRGLVIVTGHMGNWEVMCQYMARLYGFKLNIVGRSLGHALANMMATRLRTSQGNAFIYKKGGGREMLKILRQGGVVGTLIDQAAVVKNDGLHVPFMGLDSMTNAGPMGLARRTGSGVIMVLFRREGPRHLARVYPPLEFSREGDLVDDLKKLNDDLGEFIRQYPDQWLWGHRRWKMPSQRRRGTHETAGGRPPDSSI